MAKKTYDTGGEYEHFNETSYGNSQKLRKLIISSLNDIAKKYDATPINLHQQNFEGSFFSRTWSWRANFFRNLLDKVEFTHGEWPERSWLDDLVKQCGIMVYNLIYNTIIEEYKNGGNWPGAEKLPRKQRGAESVADHFANLQEKEFLENFK